MSHSLVEFHFNPRKLGLIIKQLCKDRGISKGALSSKTGVSYDTVDNIFGGKVQEVSFEKLFKFCCVIGVPIEVVMMLMVKDEDIDFRDDILLYDIEGDEALPVTNVDETQTPGPVSDTVSAVAGAVAAAEAPLDPVRKPAETAEHVAYLHQHIDHLTRLLELLITNKHGG